MLRMPDPIHPDLPCLFACAIVPALCSVVIPDACTDRWLKAIGWTADFLVSYISCMMCVLGVLSNKRDCIIQFQSKPYYIG